jgi:hypothetical protein
MLAGCNGTCDELPFGGLVIGAAGVTKPSTRECPRGSRFCFFNLNGAQPVRLKVGSRSANSSVEETPERPSSSPFESLPF